MFVSAQFTAGQNQEKGKRKTSYKKSRGEKREKAKGYSEAGEA